MTASDASMKIALGDKASVPGGLMKPIMDALAAGLSQGEDELTGNDIFDFALCGRMDQPRGDHSSAGRGGTSID